MRNLMLLSLASFLTAWFALRSFGNAGLWGAFLIHYAARGGLQALRYPRAAARFIPLMQARPTLHSIRLLLRRSNEAWNSRFVRVVYESRNDVSLIF